MHEQFEVLQLNGDKWELVAAFGDFELANGVARNRQARMRLVHATYDGGKQISQDVLADLGTTRENI